MVAEATDPLTELENQGIKLDVYWTLGRYDAVTIIDAANKKDAMKALLRFQEIVDTETLTLLFPKHLQINKREGYRAFDSGNNLFNIAYEVLRWKILRALLKAKLEPYLGFLHKISHNHAALVSDFMELYRCTIDDFLIDYSQQLKKQDFEKHYMRDRYNKKTPRIFLKHHQTNRLIKVLSKHFEKRVQIPAIRRGKEQSIETLITEEAFVIAEFLRNGKINWIPRTAQLV